jgi:N6-L-threonylcarbamoyladenine synthase
MRGYLGLDTSNYTTSCAVFRGGRVLQNKRMLPVPQGQLGLRQSDAVFLHVRALGELVEELMHRDAGDISAAGAAGMPRDAQGSYMPCFLTGVMAARTTAAVLRAPFYTFSHQAGHIAAALYGAGRTDLLGRRFVAFHVSGGTTECLLVEDLPAGGVRLLAATADLNAGQAIDRVGGMLGLSFPAGEALDALARQSDKRFRVRPSFSGDNPCLSGVENQCRALLEQKNPPRDVARFCIDAILAALDGMVQNAVRQTGCADLLFSGGVMSNSIIRAAIEQRFGGIFAPREFSCDNAAGIALLTALRCGEAIPAQKE